MPSGLRIHVNGGQLEFAKKSLRATMRTAGAEVAAAARALIRNSAGGGRTYRGPGGSAAAYRGGYKKGRYTASVAGSAPSRVTGTLARSIKVRPFKSGDGVAIRDTVFYALFLEAGAKGGGRISRGGVRVRGKGGIGKRRVLDSRPFLSAALNSRKASLGPRIQASIAQDIKLVKGKP